jgi:serine phosphatase RsbU (regulator of sigma subunit)
VVEGLDEYAGHTPDAFASTLFYARLDLASATLRYTLAGHHPPLLLRADGRADWFDAEPGPPIGVEAARTTSTCQLDVGDTLIGYTDGLVEHHLEPIEAGRQRLLDTASGAARASLTTMASELVARVPNDERPDDIVVLAMRRTA